MRWLLALWICFLCWFPTHAHAAEERIALLIANQRGWKGEPILDYVLSGDLKPLARHLRAVGFKVKTLENPTANEVRQAFRRIKANNRTTNKTFLFYYTGHADQTYFHLGPKTKHPLSYQHFTSFFKSLRATRKIAIFDSCYSGEIIREFGSLQKYKSLLKRGKTKGIRARRKLDLHKLITPKQGHEQGMRIIASSLGVSWELKEYKASVFTHHLLKGLRGPADVNHDGKITVDELFDYTSQKVMHETGQRPQQFLMLKRSTPYAIAPVYRSRLRIGSNVIGKLKVAVANFVWSKRKVRRRPLHLAVVDGKGTVMLEQRGACYRQSVMFPKGGEVELNTSWKKVTCQRFSQRRKGTLYMEAKPLADPMDVSVALSGMYHHTLAPFIQDTNFGGGVQVRWGTSWGLGLHVATGSPENKGFSLTSVWLRPEFGWKYPFTLGPTTLELFLGGYLNLGFTFQHKGELPTNTILLAGGGTNVDMSLWFTRHIGVRLGAQAGFNITPIRGESGFFFQWQVRSAILFGF